jgi:hypothetical protein
MGMTILVVIVADAEEKATEQPVASSGGRAVENERGRFVFCLQTLAPTFIMEIG